MRNFFWVLFLVGLSCGGKPPPDPPPPPPPWECEIDAPWCHLTDPINTCPCVHNPTSTPEHCELAECPADPEDPPVPSKAYPQAAVYWFGKNIADATPRVCRAPKHEVPDCYTGRYCHPVACEGDPTRLEKEVALMGGDKPVWELEVDSGNLCLVRGQSWKAVVGGRKGGRCRRGQAKGKGRLRWWFPNREARSKWLSVDK